MIRREILAVFTKVRHASMGRVWGPCFSIVQMVYPDAACVGTCCSTGYLLSLEAKSRSLASRKDFRSAAETNRGTSQFSIFEESACILPTYPCKHQL